VQAEDGNSADSGDGAGNIGGGDGAGRLRSTVPVPIYIQNRPFPMKISWGFIGKGWNLRICVWGCGRGRGQSVSGVVGAADWNWRQSYL